MTAPFSGLLDSDEAIHFTATDERRTCMHNDTCVQGCTVVLLRSALTCLHAEVLGGRASHAPGVTELRLIGL